MVLLLVYKLCGAEFFVSELCGAEPYSSLNSKGQSAFCF